MENKTVYMGGRMSGKVKAELELMRYDKKRKLLVGSEARKQYIIKKYPEFAGRIITIDDLA